MRLSSSRCMAASSSACLSASLRFFSMSSRAKYSSSRFDGLSKSGICLFVLPSCDGLLRLQPLDRSARHRGFCPVGLRLEVLLVIAQRLLGFSTGAVRLGEPHDRHRI